MAKVPESGQGTHTTASRDEEVRLAVVFNGGVALAVWMGGVATEIDALTRDAPGYGALSAMLGVRARADVIAGTSAGGINGAALALAQVNANASLEGVRRLWLRDGRAEALLQEPFTGSPSSLLQGEAFFLPRLTSAMAQLTRSWSPLSARERPVDLTICTTLLHGAGHAELDSLGQRVVQTRHDGRFVFIRRDGPGSTRHDDFATDAGAVRPDLARALGLAARASAGFPIAFEPTLVPVDGPAQEDRPDMRAFASWRKIEPDGSATDRSRWAVDGGLLANTPVRPALEAIQRMPAEREVDRVMLLVLPRGGIDDPETPGAGAAPSLLGLGFQVITALASQGNRSHIDEVLDYARRTALVRGARRDVLAAPQPTQAARMLYPVLRLQRLRQTAARLAEEVPNARGWPEERVRAAVSEVQSTCPTLVHTYVPESYPGAAGVLQGKVGLSATADLASIALDFLRALGRARQAIDGEPCVAVRMARRRVHAALATARAASDVLDDAWRSHPPGPTGPAVSYWKARLAVYATLIAGDRAAVVPAEHAAVVTQVTATLQDLDLVPPPPMLAGEPALGWILRHTAHEVCAAVVESVRAARERPHDLHDERLDTAWRPLRDAALPPRHPCAPGSAEERVADLLYALHVLTTSVGAEAKATSPLRVVQLAATTQNPFAVSATALEDKLSGEILSRFGGLLKSSWRLNDWIWGRCDAATVLIRTLLTHARIARAARSFGHPGLTLYQDHVAALLGQEPSTLSDEHLRGAATTLVDVLWGATLLDDPESATPQTCIDEAAAMPSSRHWPRLRVSYQGAITEVERILAAHLERLRTTRAETEDASTSGDPGSLVCLAELLVWRRHAVVGHHEVPLLAKEVRADIDSGANARSHGARFLRDTAALLARLEEQTSAGITTFEQGVDALAAFDTAAIGSEDLGDEISSDQFVRTTATALGVAATVLDGPHLGVPVPAPVTKAIRGAALVPFWLARGLTGASGIARALATLGLAVGGVLLVLGLTGSFGGAAAPVVLTLGGGALATALGYLALRSGSLVHTVVLAAGAALLVLTALSLSTAAAGGAMLELNVLGACIAAAVVFAAVGSIPQRGAVIPVPTGSRPLDALGTALVASLLAAVVTVSTWAALTHRPEGTWLRVHAGSLAITAGAIVLLAIATLWALSWGLRLWAARPDGAIDDSAYRCRETATASWSVVCGLLAVGATLAVLVTWPRAPGWPAEATVAAITAGTGVLLLLGLPVQQLLRARRRVRAETRLDLAGHGGSPLRPPVALEGEAVPAEEDRLAALLWSIGRSHRFFLRPRARETAGSAPPPSSLRRRGRRLLASLPPEV